MSLNSCKNCNVSIETDLKNCPLCGKFITKDIKQSAFAYPKVNLGYVKKYAVINFFKAMFFCIILICFFVNLFTGLNNPWCLYVVTGISLSYITIIIPIEKGRYLWWEFLLSLTGVCLYILFIDFFASGITYWSIIWVIPIIIGSVALGLSAFNVFVNKSDPANSLPVLIVLLLFAATFFIINLILAVNNKNVTALPSFIVLMESGFFTLLLGILRRKALKKKFYL